jgi:hypothetical protein
MTVPRNQVMEREFLLPIHGEVARSAGGAVLLPIYGEVAANPPDGSASCMTVPRAQVIELEFLLPTCGEVARRAGGEAHPA